LEKKNILIIKFSFIFNDFNLDLTNIFFRILKYFFKIYVINLKFLTALIFIQFSNFLIIKDMILIIYRDTIL